MPIAVLLYIGIIQDRDRGQIGIIGSNDTPLLCCSFVIDACKSIAPNKCISTNTLHTVGDRDAREPIAIRKCIRTNARYSIGNRDTRKFIAMRKCRRTNARHVIRNRDIRQVATTDEPTLADARSTRKITTALQTHNHRLTTGGFRYTKS